MLNHYGDWGLRKVYLAFGLTDETYSLVTTIDPKDAAKKKQQYFLITALNHSYWVISCTIGAVIGSSFSINTQGMEFTLTALFVVLLIEQWKKIKNLLPFMIAAFSVAVALYLFSEQMLLVSIALSVTLLIANNLIKKSR